MKKKIFILIISIILTLSACKTEKNISNNSTVSNFSTSSSTIADNVANITSSETIINTPAVSDANNIEYSKCWLMDLNYDGVKDMLYKIDNDPKGDKIWMNLVTDINNSYFPIDSVNTLDFYRRGKDTLGGFRNDSYYAIPIIYTNSSDYQCHDLLGTDETVFYTAANYGYGYDLKNKKYDKYGGDISKETYDYGIEHMLDDWKYIETKKLDDYSVSVEEFKEYIFLMKQKQNQKQNEIPEYEKCWLMDLNYDGIDDVLYQLTNDNPYLTTIHLKLSTDLNNEKVITYVEYFNFYKKIEVESGAYQYMIPVSFINTYSPGLSYSLLGTDGNKLYDIASYAFDLCSGSYFDEFSCTTKENYEYGIKHALDDWEYIETKRLEDYSVSVEEFKEYLKTLDN